MPALTVPGDIVRFDLSLATLQTIGTFHVELRFGMGDFSMMSGKDPDMINPAKGIITLGPGVSCPMFKTAGGYRIFSFDGALIDSFQRRAHPIMTLTVRAQNPQPSVDVRISPWTAESEKFSWCKNAAGQFLRMDSPSERGGIACVARDNVAQRIGYWQLTAETNPQ